jgi:hypothetical protein
MGRVRCSKSSLQKWPSFQQIPGINVKEVTEVSDVKSHRDKEINETTKYGLKKLGGMNRVEGI